jgi:hypothetical protein
MREEKSTALLSNEQMIDYAETITQITDIAKKSALTLTNRLIPNKDGSPTNLNDAIKTLRIIYFNSYIKVNDPHLETLYHWNSRDWEAFPNNLDGICKLMKERYIPREDKSQCLILNALLLLFLTKDLLEEKSRCEQPNPKKDDACTQEYAKNKLTTIKSQVNNLVEINGIGNLSGFFANIKRFAHDYIKKAINRIFSSDFKVSRQRLVKKVKENTESKITKKIATLGVFSEKGSTATEQEEKKLAMPNCN